MSAHIGKGLPIQAVPPNLSYATGSTAFALEIAALKQRLATAERERDEARRQRIHLQSVLRWLVRLHDETRHEDPARYQREKPLAWQAARDALKAAGQP